MEPELQQLFELRRQETTLKNNSSRTERFKIEMGEIAQKYQQVYETTPCREVRLAAQQLFRLNKNYSLAS